MHCHFFFFFFDPAWIIGPGSLNISFQKDLVPSKNVSTDRQVLIRTLKSEKAEGLGFRFYNWKMFYLEIIFQCDMTDLFLTRQPMSKRHSQVCGNLAYFSYGAVPVDLRVRGAGLKSLAQYVLKVWLYIRFVASLGLLFDWTGSFLLNVWPINQQNGPPQRPC